MKLQARETNYGTRVDYILATPGLLKWIKHGDIQPALKGSDHCPIFIDLYDEIIVPETGERLTLRDAMQQRAQMTPPRIAAVNWEEFSGRQRLLSSFFGKQNGQLASQSQLRAGPSQPEQSESSQAKEKDRTPSVSPSSSTKPPPSPSRKRLASRTPVASSSSSSKKRAHTQSTSETKSSKKRQKSDGNGQATLGSFFATQSKSTPKKAALSQASSSDAIEVDDDDDPPELPEELVSIPVDIQEQLDSDYKLAYELSLSQDVSSPPQSRTKETKTAWTSLFAPRDPPKCTVHGEPTKMFTVNKQGPNKGRTFYVCARCVSCSSLLRHFQPGY